MKLFAASSYDECQLPQTPRAHMRTAAMCGLLWTTAHKVSVHLIPLANGNVCVCSGKSNGSPVAKRRFWWCATCNALSLYHPLPTSAFRSLLRRLKSKVVGEHWGNIHLSMYRDGVLFKTSKLSTSVKEQHHAPCKCAVDAGCQQPNITCICA